MKHGFIGYGNLAKAVYQGLKDEKALEFAYFARSKKEVDMPYYAHMHQLVAFADVIWLMVKPQDLGDLLSELSLIDTSKKTIVSPAAGRTIEFIESYLNKDQLIVRIMPNLAMAYRKSVTAFATNQPENEKAKDIFVLLQKLGKAVQLEEDGFDLFTAVFGSGPAFILSFIQVFKEKMQDLYLPGPLLDELLLELTQGTTLYFSENQKEFSIEQLIQNITSKGGTTQAGLTYSKEHEIGKHIEGILDAATKKSVEMRQITVPKQN